MSEGWEHARNLLRGPLLAANPPWPLTLCSVLCDLQTRFISKCRVSRGWRSVARNGRVLLCSDLPLANLGGNAALVRLQTWHRALLPGDAPQPYGILLHARTRG